MPLACGRTATRFVSELLTQPTTPAVPREFLPQQQCYGCDAARYCHARLHKAAGALAHSLEGRCPRKSDAPAIEVLVARARSQPLVLRKVAKAQGYVSETRAALGIP